jgi:acetylornithine deacetylase/succinyl-diaminopimelate desuccinylase-like protein
MKGHGIIQLMAFIALKRAGVPLTRELVYVGNADEEIGGSAPAPSSRSTPTWSAGSSTC